MYVCLEKVIALQRLFRVWEAQGYEFNPEAAILTEIFLRFAKSFQANSGIVGPLR
jgi:hypothetical protein